MTGAKETERALAKGRPSKGKRRNGRGETKGRAQRGDVERRGWGEGRLGVWEYAGGRLTLLVLATVASLASLATLAFVATASATPTVTLKETPIPIPGFPGTGDVLGAGAEVEVQVTISGTEYGGSPSPLTGMTFFSPAGVKVTPQMFPTCTPSVLEANGPAGCPKNSRAGPVGEGLGVVSFGAARVDEEVSIQGFFAPTGGLTFYVEGSTPTSFQILEKAHWVTAGAPYGPELIVEVPLVETLPGADDASILSFKVKVGAAYRRDKKTVSYITLPKRCPKGGVPIKSELKFLSGETVTVAYKQPCPQSR
jgi:hypothetical protein